MPEISLTMRRAFNAERTDETAVALVTITHDDLDAPLRLSSDPTQRIASDPLTYGTVSNGETFAFILMSAIVPDESRQSPPKSQLVLENVASDMVALIRSFTTPAQARIDIVAASAPDFIERSFVGMDVRHASYDDARVTIDLSREAFTSEPWPSQHMTKSRFPGLHK